MRCHAMIKHPGKCKSVNLCKTRVCSRVMYCHLKTHVTREPCDFIFWMCSYISMLHIQSYCHILISFVRDFIKNMKTCIIWKYSLHVFIMLTYHLKLHAFINKTTWLFFACKYGRPVWLHVSYRYTCSAHMFMPLKSRNQLIKGLKLY